MIGNIISRFFKREPPEKTRVNLVNITNGNFSPWTGTAWENDIYRGAVDAIARNAAKLKGVHAVTYEGQKQPANDNRINRLLQVAPNEYMTAFDMLYKLTTQYYLNNNAFALLNWNEQGRLSGIYPINYTHVELQADRMDNLYVEFTFRNGKRAQFSYNDVIHLRRHFNGNEFLGDDNRALSATLELAHTQNEGLENSIKSSAHLRGILKLNQLTADVELKKIKENFVKDYLSMSNDGGIITTDKKMEYVPIENNPLNLDVTQLQAVKNKIYDYLGVSEKIVNSSYNEDEYAAFYESTVEPLAVQMSLEFTRKIFNERERAFGNQIVFESGRLQFTSNKTKVNLIKELLPYGILTINQALEILNMAPIEGGDKRLQTLNVVDAERVTEYQMMKAGKKNDGIKSNGNSNSAK